MGIKKKITSKTVIAAIVGGVFLVVGSILTAVLIRNPPSDTSSLEKSPPASTIRLGKPIIESKSFSVTDKYDPSGYMGDIGDILIEKTPDLIRFTYVTQGRGPHEWDWKYINKEENLELARFGGVMLLDPPNNWGLIENGGYDIRRFKTISWEARSIEDNVYVEFLIGGVNWLWNDDTKTKEPTPYPDSLPRTSLGTYLLTSEFQTFQYDLSKIQDDYLMNVIGGFGWVVSWSSNGVHINDDHTAPIQSKTIVIEVEQIQYKK